MNFQLIPLTQIAESKTNPRKTFDQTKLTELAESIREKGVLQPILVRPVEDHPSDYELVAGARRFRASHLAGFDSIPAIVRDLSDVEALEIQVLENLQREDVAPLEEADGYAALLASGAYGEGGDAIVMLAGKVHRSTSYVYRRLALQKLSKEWREELEAGHITFAHATHLVRLSESAQQDCANRFLYRSRWVSGKQTLIKNDPFEEFTPSDLADFIANTIIRDLTQAPFHIADNLLVKKAGACTDCAKRTGADSTLFGESGPDRCLDPACFQDKLIAHVKMIAANHEEEGFDVVFISPNYEWSNEKFAGKMILGTDKYKRVTADESSTRGIFVKGNAFATSVPIKLTATKNGSDPKHEQAMRDYQEACRKRKRALNLSYRHKLRDAVFENLPKELDRTALEAVAVAQIPGDPRGLIDLMGWAKKRPDTTEAARSIAEKNIAAANDADLIRLILVASAAYDLAEPHSEWVLDNAKLPSAESLARTLGINPLLLFKAAGDEHPKPKKPEPPTPKAKPAKKPKAVKK